MKRGHSPQVAVRRRDLDAAADADSNVMGLCVWSFPDTPVEDQFPCYMMALDLADRRPDDDRPRPPSRPPPAAAAESPDVARREEETPSPKHVGGLQAWLSKVPKAQPKARLHQGRLVTASDEEARRLARAST